jgi:transcriptional regulator with XRE-family HTH domain
MALNIASLLDKAKVIHNLPSDYKLALVMGVEQGSLRNYRAGKTLPDSRVITKICELTGDDPYMLAVQIEAERAKTAEAKTLWAGIALRLQTGVATMASMAVTFALSLVFTLGAGVSDAQASPVANEKSKPLYIMYSSFMAALNRLIRRVVRLTGPILAVFMCPITGVQNEKALFQSA